MPANTSSTSDKILLIDIESSPDDLQQFMMPEETTTFDQTLKDRTNVNTSGAATSAAGASVVRAQTCLAPTKNEITAPTKLPINLTMTATQTGPMSTNIIVPARPKPGRKASTSNPGDQTDKRRAQNRSAQRKYRDRRQERLDEAIQELRQTEQVYRQSEAAVIKNERAHQLRITELESQLQVANARIRQLEEAARLSNPAKTAAPTRDAGVKGLHERNYPPPVDFTSYGHSVDLEMQDEAFKCGFCTDASNCLCKPTTQPKHQPIQAGNCPACQSDPARAAACRRMAATATPESGLMTPTLSGDGTESLTITASAPTISCVEFMDRANRVVPFPSIHELFGDLVRARPSGNGGYELDEQEAAQGIALLARSRP